MRLAILLTVAAMLGIVCPALGQQVAIEQREEVTGTMNAPATAEAQDSSGNFYIGGLAESGEVIVQKLSPGGTVMWTNRVTGGPDSTQQVVKLIPMPGGELVEVLNTVPSSEYANDIIVNFVSSGGSSLWTVPIYNDDEILGAGRTSAGNIIIASRNSFYTTTDSYDNVTILSAVDGHTSAAQSLHLGLASDFVADGLGHDYLSSLTVNGWGITRIDDSSAQKSWLRILTNVAGRTFLGVRAMKILSSGDVVVDGTASTDGTSVSGVTFDRIQSSGSFVYRMQVESSAPAIDVETDSSNDVLACLKEKFIKLGSAGATSFSVAGKFSSCVAGTSNDSYLAINRTFLEKVAPSGSVLWSDSYATNPLNVVGELFVDSTDNLYIVGNNLNNGNLGQTFGLASFASATGSLGTNLASAISGHLIHTFEAVKSDSSGNMAIIGRTGEVRSVESKAPDGSVNWSHSISGSYPIGLCGLSLGPQNQIAIYAGEASGGYLINLYSPSGNLLWSDNFSNPATSPIRAQGLAIGQDSNGSVYVVSRDTPSTLAASVTFSVVRLDGTTGAVISQTQDAFVAAKTMFPGNDSIIVGTNGSVRMPYLVSFVNSAGSNDVYLMLLSVSPGGELTHYNLGSSYSYYQTALAYDPVYKSYWLAAEESSQVDVLKFGSDPSNYAESHPNIVGPGENAYLKLVAKSGYAYLVTSLNNSTVQTCVSRLNAANSATVWYKTYSPSVNGRPNQIQVDTDRFGNFYIGYVTLNYGAASLVNPIYLSKFDANTGAVRYQINYEGVYADPNDQLYGLVAEQDGSVAAVGVTPGTSGSRTPYNGSEGLFFQCLDSGPPVGHPEKYAVITGTTLSGNVSSGDENTFGASFTLTSRPSHSASFGMTSTGDFTYKSAPGFTGTDSFTYQIRTSAGVANALVKITVTN